MEGHAPLPDRRDLQGVLEVVGGTVEQDVAEPAPGDDAEDDPGQQRLHLLGRRPLVGKGAQLGAHPLLERIGVDALGDVDDACIRQNKTAREIFGDPVAYGKDYPVSSPLTAREAGQARTRAIAF